MTLAHNMTVRHLNAIYLQATGVHDATDIRDFLFFCATWVDELHAHHSGEESILFPMLHIFTGISGVMAESEEQHRAFMEGVDRLAGYVQDTSVAQYSGAELRAIIRTFAGPLLRHLRDEPVQLLEIGERFGGEGLKGVWEKFEARLIKEGMAKWDKVSPGLMKSIIYYVACC
jgi:hemerythrin-like domain-containing protein